MASDRSAAWMISDTPASCATSDPELWFSDDYNEQRAAVKTCRSCPLIEPCLTYALHNKVEGIWGGTLDKERKALRRVAGIKAKPLRPTHGFVNLR